MNVLDKGYVKLLAIMGDDCTPATAARVSYGNEARGWDEGDGKLTAYLLDHGHMSPFEMVEMMWEVKAPIFVARQWVRHRTANWNEFSMRYADPGRIGTYGEVDYYTPAAFLGQSGVNKQSSGAPIEEQERARRAYDNAHVAAIGAYESLVRLGVSREQARAVLPVSVYTHWIWKCDLRNTLHFLELRDHDGAQEEIRAYAKAMIEMLHNALPNLMDLWESRRSK